MNESQRYYDAFSDSYEDERHKRYHRLLDDLETELAQRYCRGRVLEAGCGTGLILQRLVEHAPQGATGLDLSLGMLQRAHQRQLTVTQGSIDKLPFADATFDAVLSFKVLAHVPAIEDTLVELARVTRPGGHLLLEFYNRTSLRYAIKALKRPTPIAQRFTDHDVFTRYDSWPQIRSYVPPTVELCELRGVRIFTPFAQAHEVPLLGRALDWAERNAADNRLLRRLGGFLIVVLRRR